MKISLRPLGAQNLPEEFKGLFSRVPQKNLWDSLDASWPSAGCPIILRRNSCCLRESLNFLRCPFVMRQLGLFSISLRLRFYRCSVFVIGIVF